MPRAKTTAEAKAKKKLEKNMEAFAVKLLLDAGFSFRELERYFKSARTTLSNRIEKLPADFRLPAKHNQRRRQSVTPEHQQQQQQHQQQQAPLQLQLHQQQELHRRQKEQQELHQQQQKELHQRQQEEQQRLHQQQLQQQQDLHLQQLQQQHALQQQQLQEQEQLQKQQQQVVQQQQQQQQDLQQQVLLQQQDLQQQQQQVEEPELEGGGAHDDDMTGTHGVAERGSPSEGQRREWTPSTLATANDASSEVQQPASDTAAASQPLTAPSPAEAHAANSAEDIAASPTKATTEQQGITRL